MIHNHCRAQRGATLLVSLTMLVVLTLFAVSGFNMSSVNLKIAGNFQQKRNVELSVQQAMEQAISNIATFTPAPAVQSITVNGISVSITAAACYHTAPATGYDITYGSPVPEDNVWELKGDATDSFGGAKTTITQGVAVRMPAGNCT